MEVLRGVCRLSGVGLGRVCGFRDIGRFVVRVVFFLIRVRVLGFFFCIGDEIFFYGCLGVFVFGAYSRFFWIS